MPDQVLQNHTIVEHSIRIIVSVVVIVNILITIAATALWRSFKNFKEDIKLILRDFMSGHTEKHETLDTQIETLFNRDRQDLDRLSRMEQGLDDQKDLCKDHRVHCSGRRQS